MRGLRTDFSSANKLKEKFDQKIEDLQQPQASNHAALHQPGLSACSAHRRLRKRKWISFMPNSTSEKLKQ